MSWAYVWYRPSGRLTLAEVADHVAGMILSLVRASSTQSPGHRRERKVAKTPNQVAFNIIFGVSGAVIGGAFLAVHQAAILARAGQQAHPPVPQPQQVAGGQVAGRDVVGRRAGSGEIGRLDGRRQRHAIEIDDAEPSRDPGSCPLVALTVGRLLKDRECHQDKKTQSRTKTMGTSVYSLRASSCLSVFVARQLS